jgi:PAS domain S-box-containing protein
MYPAIFTGRSNTRKKKGISLDTQKSDWLAQMGAVLETLNEGVLIVDVDDKVLFVNSVFEEMTGYLRQYVVGTEAIREFYSTEDRQVLLERRDSVRHLGRSRQEFFLPTKDGGRLPVVIGARCLYDPNGRQLVIITFTDITEQKSAETQLRAANRLLEDRQHEIDEDLSLAARVQHSLAPKAMTWANLRVEAHYNPMLAIGGDFGLVSHQADDRLNLLVCDVSGHGIGSALVANRIYTEAVAQLRSTAPLDDVLRYLNRFVLEDISSSTAFYFTMAAARVECANRHMTFAGAGHPPAMIVTPGEQPRLLMSNSMVLGALPEAVDSDAVINVDLVPLERIVLYTDGVTEVFDSSGEMLGVEGLQEFVRQGALLPLHEMKQFILDKVAAWRDGPPTDDMSLVLVEVL